MLFSFGSLRLAIHRLGRPSSRGRRISRAFRRIPPLIPGSGTSERMGCILARQEDLTI
jgi:hypothetical protein